MLSSAIPGPAERVTSDLARSSLWLLAQSRKRVCHDLLQARGRHAVSRKTTLHRIARLGGRAFSRATPPRILTPFETVSGRTCGSQEIRAIVSRLTIPGKTLRDWDRESSGKRLEYLGA